MRTHKTYHYTQRRLSKLYGDLIGDAIVIQKVGRFWYDIIDVGYDMAMHFHHRYHTPAPKWRDCTKRNLTLQQAIDHAEYCKAMLKRYHQQTGGQETEAPYDQTFDGNTFADHHATDSTTE